MKHGIYLDFKLVIRSPAFWVPPYSPYQQELWDITSSRRSEGWTYDQIADWFNENGYQTVRGKSFSGRTTFSILKKKRLSDERFKRPARIGFQKMKFYFHTNSS